MANVKQLALRHELQLSTSPRSKVELTDSKTVLLFDNEQTRQDKTNKRQADTWTISKKTSSLFLSPRDLSARGKITLLLLTKIMIE